MAPKVDFIWKDVYQYETPTHLGHFELYILNCNYSTAFI